MLLVASLGLTEAIGFSFLPEEEQKYAMLTYSPGPGKRLADVEAAALEAERLILNRQGVMNLQYSVGGQTPMGGASNKSALFNVQYENETASFKQEKEALLKELRKLDSAGKWSEMDFAGGGLGSGKFSLIVYGESLEQIKPEVERIREELLKVGSFEKIESSVSQTYEQYTIAANQQKLAKLGLTAGQIAMKLAPVRDRPVLAEVTVDSKPYNVYENTETKPFATIADIENMTIASPLSVEVPIKDVAAIEKGTSANTIIHKDGKLYVEVTANITAKDVGKASNGARSRIEALGLPPGIQIDYGGVTQQMNETFTQLGMAMAAAVAIVYLLLVITFGGALTPFAILFSLPITIIGSLAALYVTNETISASANADRDRRHECDRAARSRTAYGAGRNEDTRSAARSGGYPAAADIDDGARHRRRPASARSRLRKYERQPYFQRAGSYRYRRLNQFHAVNARYCADRLRIFEHIPQETAACFRQRILTACLCLKTQRCSPECVIMFYTGGDRAMFTLEEKEYMLRLMAKEKRRGLFGLRKLPAVHDKLKGKLEQMIRNEQVNRKHL